MMYKLTDSYNRHHDYLRISLTDRCNFNCIYCNPVNDSTRFDNLLTFNEHLRIIKLFSSQLGFNKFRFTGGEPLVRKGIFQFFEDVKRLKDEYQFITGLTTNASLLKGKVKTLKNSGIDKLNISLDSLNSENFYKITNHDRFDETIKVINEAIGNGYESLKINCVIIKGENDTDIIDFVKFAIDKNVNIRFIEFMPFGNNDWQHNGFISYREMMEIISTKYELIPDNTSVNDVAKAYKISNNPGKISFITSMSEHFCGSCNRLRLSAEGSLRLCLFSDGSHELNLRDMIRSGRTDGEIVESLKGVIKLKWEKHPGAEELINLKNNNMLKIGG